MKITVNIDFYNDTVIDKTYTFDEDMDESVRIQGTAIDIGAYESILLGGRL